MTDHQGLTDEQLECLREMPCVLNIEPHTSLKKLGLCEIANWDVLPLKVRRTDVGDTLLATLDHHTTKAKEDERRRIDGLADRAGIVEYLEPDGDGISTPSPYWSAAWGDGEGKTMIEALEAAAATTFTQAILSTGGE